MVKILEFVFFANFDHTYSHTPAQFWIYLNIHTIKITFSTLFYKTVQLGSSLIELVLDIDKGQRKCGTVLPFHQVLTPMSKASPVLPDVLSSFLAVLDFLQGINFDFGFSHLSHISLLSGFNS